MDIVEPTGMELLMKSGKTIGEVLAEKDAENGLPLHSAYRIEAQKANERLRLPRPERTEMMSLTERRAKFVYEAARIAAEAAQAPIIPAHWDDREEPFRKQFLEVIERQCGPQRSRSPEELHGSWMQAYFLMGWKYGEKYDREAKTHPDLVPYADLGQLERDKDAVFVALCEIARQWIYES